MSIFEREAVTCPSCGHSAVLKVAHSVNAERSPHLREQVLEGTLHRPTCERCGARFELDRPFSYMDLPRNEWIGVYGLQLEGAWAEVEAHPQEVHDLALHKAPDFVFDIAVDARVRTVFGVDALREKLICFDAGLDDVELEVFKYALMTQGLDLEEGVYFRLWEVTGDTLRFVLQDHDGVQGVEVERARFDEVVAEARWEPIRTAMQAGPYVDVGRLIYDGHKDIM